MGAAGTLVTLALVITTASTKFIDPDIFELDDHDRSTFRTFDKDTSDHYDSEHHEPLPDKKDLLKTGLWALKAKIEQLKMFEAAVHAKLKADKKKFDDDLHEKLEKLVHHKKKPAVENFVPKDPSYYYTGHYEDTRPVYRPAPAQPAQPAQYPPPEYDPYYGH